jgi:signal transduction histidine kinase
MELMMEQKKVKLIHTVRINSFFGANPSEKEIYQAMKEFKRIQRFLRWVPILFFGIMVAIFVIVLNLTRLNLPAFLLVIFSTVIILKELSTLFFSIQMRNRLMKPIEKLREGVEEISKGHYGYTVDEDPLNMVGDLVASFNRMSLELKEANDLKLKYEQNRKELIAGISHDLKTPITSIVGYVDAIQSGVANTQEKCDRFLNIIGANAQYTNDLIDDLFLFSKLDINQMKYQFVKLPIFEFLKDVFIEKQLELEEKGVKVNFDIQINKEKKIAIDGKLVYRIVSNILSNAVKYGNKETPEINIVSDEIENGIRVSIADNGQGISRDDMGQIFDVFYRADASRNKEIGGSGLGLAIAKQLVEAHKGTIEANSRIGHGTTITFTLIDQPTLEEKNG